MAIRGKQTTRLKAIVVALAGGALLVMAAVMAVQSLLVVKFHSVQGTVVSKRLHSNVVGRFNLHKPVIEYSYVVRGVAYRNDVFSRVDDDGTEQWALAILEDYRVGGLCTVYYDPSSPQTSALSKLPTRRTIWLMLGSAFVGLVHLIGGLLLARECAQTCQTACYRRGVVA